MKIEFDMIAEPLARAKLETLDFDPEVARRFALELLSMGTDFASAWVTFHYDEGDSNRVVDYDIIQLPENTSDAGQA